MHFLYLLKASYGSVIGQSVRYVSFDTNKGSQRFKWYERHGVDYQQSHLWAVADRDTALKIESQVKDRFKDARVDLENSTNIEVKIKKLETFYHIAHNAIERFVDQQPETQRPPVVLADLMRMPPNPNMEKLALFYANSCSLEEMPYDDEIKVLAELFLKLDKQNACVLSKCSALYIKDICDISKLENELEKIENLSKDIEPPTVSKDTILFPHGLSLYLHSSNQTAKLFLTRYIDSLISRSARSKALEWKNNLVIPPR